MLGKRGTGKTQRAVCVACNAMRKGLTVHYATAIEMFSAITDTYGTKEKEREVVRQFAWPKLLIIDDAGERRETRNEDLLLTWVVDVRYRKMFGTLLCANLTPDAFADSVGPSITSRIWEDGAVIEVNDHNWRKDGKA